MRTAAASRKLADRVIRNGLRQKSGFFSQLHRLASPVHRRFLWVVVKSQADFVLGRLRPAPGQAREHMRAAVGWLLRAQEATPDDGVSLGYFPFHYGAGPSGWLPSYPETTGYIIPSLLEYGALVGDASVRARARRMAIWETTVQMPSGAVPAGLVRPPDERRPSAFNTGMVLQGYVALLLEHEEDGRILEGAQRAADFLVRDMGEEGHFRTHGPFASGPGVKTYACLCAWPLYRFGQLVGEKRYVGAAVRAVEAALGQQAPNGWFANNCLTRPEKPLTHMIGYAMQGILEVGLLAGREDFVAAVGRAARPLLARIAPSGFLHGRYDAGWEPARFSSCLTGSAQIAGVLYRLFEHEGHPRYREGADRLVDFLKALQILDSSNPGVNGALPGSFPILGEYMTGGYPNWATKYLLDALMLQERISQGR